MTRGIAPKGRFTFRTSQGPEATKVTLDPEKTALVIVDMQNFFLDPKIRDHPTGLASVVPTIDLIAKCRKLGIQVSIPFLPWLSELANLSL